jgi:hypothetical protein
LLVNGASRRIKKDLKTGTVSCPMYRHKIEQPSPGKDLERKIKMSEDSTTSQAASLPPKTVSQQPGDLANPYVNNRFLIWLAGLMRLTEKEQEEAGIDLRYQS